MPSYTFQNKETEQTIDVILTIKEREEFLSANPQYVQIIKPLGFIAGINQKPHDGFRDILREIKKANPGSTVNTF